jgi:hypothetical protein
MREHDFGITAFPHPPLRSSLCGWTFLSIPHSGELRSTKFAPGEFVPEEKAKYRTRALRARVANTLLV